jgi:PRTRC genetic system protein A
MFQVHVNDGKNEMPTDDIFYIVAKEGLFLKKRLGVMESIAPVKNISILESVALSAQMHIPKVPARPFAKVVEFFKAVYNEHHSECVVLIFYNEETQQFKIIPPKQEVSFASIDYDRLLIVDGYTMIGTIHSHGSMSAFHSGIDDDDEKTFDGLHITIGDIDEDEQSISSSIVANGYRFMVDPIDYVASIKITKDIDETKVGYRSKIYKIVDGKTLLDEKASKKTSYTWRKIDKRFVTTVPQSKRQFNKLWMKKIKKETRVYGYYGGRSSRFSYHGIYPYHYGEWGPHFDPHVWQQYHKLGSKRPSDAILPVSAKESVSVQKLVNTADDNDDEYIVPCLTCKFRDEKLELDDEDLENEMYRCEKCNIIIGGDSDKLECPNCKTDEHLVLLDDENLTDNYVEDDHTPLTSGDSQFYEEIVICPFCKKQTILIPPDNYCQHCFTEIEVLSSEDAIIQQSENDSGAFLDSEYEEVNEETIRQLSDHNKENVTKIPDPKKTEIPISEKKSEIWKSMMKRVFSRGSD